MGSQPMSTDVHRSPYKLWRFTVIPYLTYACTSVHVVLVLPVSCYVSHRLQGWALRLPPARRKCPLLTGETNLKMLLCGNCFQISPPNFASKFTTFSGLIGGATTHKSWQFNRQADAFSLRLLLTNKNIVFRHGKGKRRHC